MNSATDRLNAALQDRYRVERELGAGGMATVYLAHDLKHERKVAIKVLKPELAAVLGADRFLQEIKTTASLQHPNILPLFDSGQADGFLYYVMPYVEGETLREKLNRETQLGIDEAVRIATEVAGALDYAHRHYVVHRDIKPENILLHDGRPMVADFGIALAVSAAAGGRMTETGLSLGTPHYMSPEQATAEKTVTNRSDIYSLGCVLYEMLAGEPPHTGSSAQAIILKIIADAPRPVTELRKSVPLNVAAALRKALEKLPADRFQTAERFAAALEDPSFLDDLVDRGTTGSMRPRRWFSYGWAAITALAAMAAGLGIGLWMRSPGEPLVSEFAIPLSGEHEISNAQGVNIALSPDGRWLVFRGRTQLWRRSLDDLEILPVPGTEEARNPVVSPDGQSVAFVSLERLRVVSLEGGPPRTLVESGVAGGFGGIDWASDGTLYFVDQQGAVNQVPATGGAPERLTTPEPGTAHAWVDALPGGRGVLFTIAPGTDPTLSELAVYSHTDAAIHPLGLKGAMARYEVTGHLVFAAADQRLMTVGFDLGRMGIVGEPLSTGTEIMVYNGSASQFALSGNGALLYEPPADLTEAVPVWVTRNGSETEIDSQFQVHSYSDNSLTGLSLSPDARRIVISDLRSGLSRLLYSRQLLVKDLNESPAVPFASDAGASWTDFGPTWLGDGFVVFLSNRNRRGSVWRQHADGSGDPELLLARERSIYLATPSPDGTWIVFREDGDYDRDLLAVRPSEGDQVVRLEEVGSRGGGLSVSPDGRWLAYVSDLSGRRQVLVRRFPDSESPQWPVPATGGQGPVWSRDGKELFFRNAEDQMVAVRVSGDSVPVFGPQEVLFPAAGYLQGFNRLYDVAPDGRFVMLRAAPADRTTEIVVVLNFSERLKQRFAASTR